VTVTGAARLVCLKFAGHTKYFPRGAFRSQKGTATSMEPLILFSLTLNVGASINSCPFGIRKVWMYT